MINVITMIPPEDLENSLYRESIPKRLVELVGCQVNNIMVIL